MSARILIIEDDAASLELASYLLECAGHQPFSEDNGAAGVETARAQRPDLLMCDLQIPLMDGYTVVRTLKADPSWRRVPMIAVTALSMPGDREKTLAAGFDGYLSKPIAPDTFVRDIEAFLPEQLRGGGR